VLAFVFSALGIFYAPLKVTRSYIRNRYTHDHSANKVVASMVALAQASIGYAQPC
jgi:hypothetical protein